MTKVVEEIIFGLTYKITVINYLKLLLILLIYAAE